jgi:hypothetical protein
MAFSDFTLERIAPSLGVTTGEAELFPDPRPIVAPAWLIGILENRTQLALISEKARSEFIVAPILVASANRHDRRGQEERY